MNSMNRPGSQMESYKMQILSQGKYQNAEISNLIDQIKSIQRGVELHFVDLSVFKNNQTDKVLKRHEN
jgi:hypothetical protein